MTTIYSWNVNGLRAVLKNGFMDWFESAQPDVLCLQETRLLPEEVPESVRNAFGYHSFWNPAEKKGYSGTAIFSKAAPLSVKTMGIPEFDREGRLQVVEYAGYTILNGYWPNSQEERKRIAYKVAFCEAVRKVADGLVKKKKNVVLCGDFNIAHEPIDLARPKENENSAGYYIEEREAMTRFLDAGYVDTFRRLHPEKVQYSWWSYRGGARGRNVGWRIDYHCVNKAFASKVTSAWICDDVLGSDHCPVALEIA